jgi:large subunit ribosomal protein L21e
MSKSHGMKRKARDKLSKSVRARGISPVIKAIQDFKEGDKVHVHIDPSRHKGMPHPKFMGKTGEVVGKRGRAFLLKVTDGNSTKIVISKPEHLTAQK